MKNAYDYLVKNDIISKNMKGVISIKCYALDGREIYNGLNDDAIKKLKGFIDREELNKALYDLNKDNYDNVYLFGDIITGRIERTLYNIEKKINKNIDIQKKAFKDSKIIKKRIKETKNLMKKENEDK